MIRPNPILNVYVAEKAAANLVVTTHRHPHPRPQRITERQISNHFFNSLLVNRGNALRALKRFDEALESYDRLLAFAPDHQSCQINKAYLLLALGKFAEGWQKYEWRRRTNDWIGRSPPGPEWDKRETMAQRFLFYSEQGLGDTIQFCRFASIIAAEGRKVFLAVQPVLVKLLKKLEGVEIIENGETLPEYDVHLPLMSLPKVLGGVHPEITLGTVPYLFAEPARIEAWAKRVPAGGFRIGIVWQGNPIATGKGRSFPLAALAPLCRVPGVKLISLQKGHGIEQLASLPPGITVETLGADFDSGPDAFLDSGAVMMNLDLIISCDTASAHLAGALGCPVWIVLKHMPDFRWMVDRDDTPWYPTARLFRQTRHDDWDDVFERVANELASRLPT